MSYVMKKFFRILFKIPLTPFVVGFWALFYLCMAITQFFEWVYDASALDKSVTRDCKQDAVNAIKKWFTKL